MVSEQTARRELEFLSAAIGFWDDEYHLDDRPKVLLPKKRESNRDALTEEQVVRLLKAAKGFRWENGRWHRLQKSSIANRAHLERFILIALHTGSRSDVIKRLRWCESLSDPWIDLDDGMIYRRGRDEQVASNKRRPQAKLSPTLLNHLKQWHKQDAKNDVALVVHHGGKQVDSVRTGFAGCVRDAGLPQGVTAHWLRHTAATRLMEKNVPVWEAAGYLGMTVQTLEKHYAKHRPNHQSAAANAMG